MITDDHIKDLLEKYLQNSLSAEEYRELLNYFGDQDLEITAKQLLYDNFTSETTEDNEPNAVMQNVMDNAFVRIEHRIEKQKYSFVKKWLPYAAAVLAVLSISAYWYINHYPVTRPNLSTELTTDISPGSNRATLILDNGKSIALNENSPEIKVSENGIFYQDGTAVVEKTDVQQATLSTPRKGEYRIVLPDGSKVWLNAESEISYPTVFQGNERLVKLKGEAYFEVNHDPAHPFIVQSSGQRVKVLGTSFNINAYPNEAYVITTLTSGRIDLQHTTKNTHKILSPGQQAVLGDDLFRLQKVDVQLFTAWKDGKFRFKGASLQEVLRQLERWYDIEVDYSQVPADIKIYASIKRDKKLSSVLGALAEISGIHFKLEGRRLMIPD